VLLEVDTKNKEQMAVILFWKLEKNSIVRDMSKATADRKESYNKFLFCTKK